MISSFCERIEVYILSLSIKNRDERENFIGMEFCEPNIKPDIL